jgi:Zn-dependent metalloprotease
MHRVHVCSIIPPHIHRHIAEHGETEEMRRRARATLEAASHARGHREAMAGVRHLLLAAAAEGPMAKVRAIYDAKHKKALPGKLVRSEGGTSNGDAAADEAYDGSGKTYDLYATVFGRNSIDGRGMRIDSSVHYGKDFSNAQWNGKQMLYGDGDGYLFHRFTHCLDVIGHELTHGVTQYSANLDYHDQPGALNEHFSDVFGMLVKQFSLKQSAKKSDWILGEGIFTKRVNAVGVRSMKAPGTAYDDPKIGKDPQPSHMAKYVRKHEDNGGVHVNSGIPNHAFYLLATTLGGNAWETAGHIWYLTLTERLRHDASFQTCADVTFMVAGELHGKGSEPQKAVAAAWKHVGIAISPRVAAGEPKMVIKKQVPAFEPATGGAEVPPDEIRAASRRVRGRVS